MIEGGNKGVIVREFAIIVPLSLPMSGRVEDKIKSTHFHVPNTKNPKSDCDP